MGKWWAETFASIVTSIQKATASLSGQQPGSGALAVSAQKATAALVGNQPFTGSIAASAQKATASLTGAMQPAGGLTADLKKLLFSGAGGMAVPGILAATMQQATTALSANQPFTGSIAASAQKATTALAGGQTQTGTLATATAKATAALLGNQPFTATVSTDLLKATAALTGGQTQAGTLTADLIKATTDLSGTHGQNGALAAALQKATTALAGEQPTSGNLATAMAKAVAAISGNQPFTGSIAASAQKATAAMAGGQTQAGTLVAAAAKAIAALAGNWVNTAQPVITGSTTATSNTVTLPSHAVGNWIYMIAYRDGSNSAPTTPSAGGTVPTWETFMDDSSGDSNSLIVRRAKATATNHTSGTWSNTTHLLCFVVSGAHAVVAPRGATGGAVSSTLTAPAIDLYDSTGLSQIVHVYATRRGTGGVAPDAAPSGYTRITSVNNTVSGVCANLKDSTTSDGSIAQGWNNNGQRWRALSFEIVSVDNLRPYVVGFGQSTSTATISIPAHVANDVILIFCSGSGATIPTAPSAGGTVPTWTTIESATSGAAAFNLVGTVATANNHTSGSFTNQGAMSVLVIRGAAGSPLGGHASATGSGQPMSTPAVTLSDADGSSAVFRFHVAVNANVWPAPPSGYYNISNQAYNLGYYGIACDAKYDTTAAGAVNRDQGTSNGWASTAVEVLAA